MDQSSVRRTCLPDKKNCHIIAGGSAWMKCYAHVLLRKWGEPNIV